VGCAEGYLSKMITSKGCEVVGIELDKWAALKAEKYCKEVIVGNIESIELHEKYYNYFDYIILADVLEHLKDPVKILNKFDKYLKNDGYIIISVPNIANWRIRFKLLMGNFDYKKFGILDEEHIRFFTEKTAKKLVIDAGFVICNFDLTVGDLNKLAKLSHSLGFIWPNFMAYQFFIVARKGSSNEV
jgi:2-polyprenyl-3-methyl-5-hydroxy-6-metoxy-1,4-benzoquinol methylase